MTLGGTTSGTNAGSYNATFTATSNYSIEGSISAVSVSWSIGRKSVTKPSQSGTLTYSGSSQSPSWSNYNTTYMTIGGTTSGTNVGSYNATFTPTANYSIGGTTTAVTVAWSIGRKSVSTPTQSGTLTYSGSAQSPKWNSNYNTTYMSLGGTTSGTNVGSYTATFTATSNYLIDGETSKNVTWSISQANGYVTLSATSATLTYPTTSGTFTVKSHHGGTLSVSRNTSSYATANLSGTTITYGWSAVGSTTITVTSGATTNYKSASANFTLTTAKGTSAITLSATSGTITKGKTVTFTVNNQLSRTLSVSSNNTSVATVSISGTTVTVTGVGAGSANITVSASATSYYNASSVTYTATIRNELYVIKGSDTIIQYSTNLTSWTGKQITTLSTSQYCNDYAIGNNLYVVSGGSSSTSYLHDSIYKSNDCNTWTKVALDADKTVGGKRWSMFFANGYFFSFTGYSISGVATGDGFYSSDGTTWTKLNHGIYCGNPIKALVYGVGGGYTGYFALEDMSYGSRIYYSNGVDNWQLMYSFDTTDVQTAYDLITYNGIVYLIYRGQSGTSEDYTCIRILDKTQTYDTKTRIGYECTGYQGSGIDSSNRLYIIANDYVMRANSALGFYSNAGKFYIQYTSKSGTTKITLYEDKLIFGACYNGTSSLNMYNVLITPISTSSSSTSDYLTTTVIDTAKHIGTSWISNKPILKG